MANRPASALLALLVSEQPTAAHCGAGEEALDMAGQFLPKVLPWKPPMKESMA